MKRYLYSIATFVVIGLLFATFIIVLPIQILSVIQGVGFLNMSQNLVMIPFIAASVGIFLAGIPVVLTGFSMAYFNRFSLPILLLATNIVGVFLEYFYCSMLNIQSAYIPYILIVTVITTCCLCLLWRFWLEPRITD
ncbi:hypothetical protein DM558_01905 [Entomomonas moraniae]|uniref:Uncharacterized protein n=1 Tax=Entomomonas moraniae TaxID=2213226 RepID=A0A3Q9JMK7_9GAMM|nr:hypothetical protein [Entomomonas moraniae]AZS49605.1 hypothetical protein DM558_01905 [Entomomonas moraniae]